MMNTSQSSLIQEELANSKARAEAFPKLLMQLLNDEVAPDALYWLPDGKAFALNPDKIYQVLDTHFQKTKYSSFIRRLHNEGYRRQTRKYKKVDGLTLPEGTVVLSHALFQRDAPELLANFYKKTSNEAPKPTPSALQQAKAENKVSVSTQSRVMELLDGSASTASAAGISPLSTHIKTLGSKPEETALLGLSALPRLGSSLTTSAAPTGLPDLGSALYGTYAAQAQATPFDLTKSYAALRQARQEETIRNLARLQQLQQKPLSRTNSNESMPNTNSLSRSPSNESVPTAAAPGTSTTAAAALLDSQLRLQQLRWENSRRQLEEQTHRLSAMEALRLRAAAAYSANPQWP